MLGFRQRITVSVGLSECSRQGKSVGGLTYCQTRFAGVLQAMQLLDLDMHGTFVTILTQGDVAPWTAGCVMKKHIWLSC